MRLRYNLYVPPQSSATRRAAPLEVNSDDFLKVSILQHLSACRGVVCVLELSDYLGLSERLIRQATRELSASQLVECEGDRVALQRSSREPWLATDRHRFYGCLVATSPVDKKCVRLAPHGQLCTQGGTLATLAPLEAHLGLTLVAQDAAWGTRASPILPLEWSGELQDLIPGSSATLSTTSLLRTAGYGQLLLDLYSHRLAEFVDDPPLDITILLTPYPARCVSHYILLGAGPERTSLHGERVAVSDCQITSDALGVQELRPEIYGSTSPSVSLRLLVRARQDDLSS
jgi:hypothetical protein